MIAAVSGTDVARRSAKRGVHFIEPRRHREAGSGETRRHESASEEIVGEDEVEVGSFGRIVGQKTTEQGHGRGRKMRRDLVVVLFYPEEKREFGRKAIDVGVGRAEQNYTFFLL